MSKIKNILFVMYDQLRADYLGCYGHPTISTPAMDALAHKGVKFDRAYCQSPVCGPSRMSFYTGRYVTSHGATWNNVPLPLSELTIGDYLTPHGYRVAAVGETHFVPDMEGMRRVGLDADNTRGKSLADGGFEDWDRDDQLHPDQAAELDFKYNEYLRANGYEGENPWHEYANAAEGPNGEILSGWYMRNAHLPARVKEEHSETAYFTNRAMEFISDAGDQPWCLHLSYMKPHWPYMAPTPYHKIYSSKDVIPANRSDVELSDMHPVVKAFLTHDDSISFREEEKRCHVIPTYMGLIKQADDHLARLLKFLEDRGIADETLVVVTSDHGSYLGDHWLGEKELFHEESVRIPLIVYDPRKQADTTRGMTESRFAEAIDLLPTFLDALGLPPVPHRLEGRSLLPLLHGKETQWRNAAISEHDYGFMRARRELGLGPSEAKSYMLRTDKWKYIFFEGFRPQLFDLENDPKELNDLGAASQLAEVRAELHEQLFTWFRNRAIRRTMSDEVVDARTDTARQRGILIEIW